MVLRIGIKQLSLLNRGQLNVFTRNSTSGALRGIGISSSYTRHYSSKEDHGNKHDDHHGEEHDDHGHHDEHPLAPPEDFVGSPTMKFIGLVAAMGGIYYLNGYLESKGGLGLKKYITPLFYHEDPDESFKKYQLDAIAERDYEKFWEDQYKKTDYTNYKHHVAVPGRHFSIGNPYQEGLIDLSKMEPRRKTRAILYDEVN